jgi:polyferredoxin
MGRFGGIVWKKRPRVKAPANKWLKLTRYLVLIVALYFTYRTGELVLRGYDPFYLIFSGFGHGSAGVISIIVLALTAIGAFVVPMLFCRYLCPLGAVFDPFSRIGLIKITRDETTCTMCGDCSAACPHDIPVPELKIIRERDCTNCLECLDACPEKNTLEIQAKL